MKKIAVFLIMVLMASSGYAMEIEQENVSSPVERVESIVAINVMRSFMQWWLDTQNDLPKPKPNLFALHQACNVGNFDQVRKRVEAGFSINDKDEDGDAPIHKAVKGGFIKIVRYLLEKGAEIEAKDSNGKTPIDIINEIDIINKNVEAAKHTMKFDTSKDFDTGFTEMVYLLVEKGANVNVQNEQKRTILNALISLPIKTDIQKQKRKECIDLLIKSDAKIFNKKKDKLVSLCSPVVKNQSKAAQLLLFHT